MRIPIVRAGVSSSITGSSKTIGRSSNSCSKKDSVSVRNRYRGRGASGRQTYEGGVIPFRCRIGATKEIRGSYAIAAMCEGEPHTLLVARSGCPLVIGRNGKSSLVASDVMAMLAHTRDVTYLEEGDLAVVTPTDIRVMDSKGQPVTARDRDYVGRRGGGKKRLSALHVKGNSRTAANHSRYPARPLFLRDGRGRFAGP